MTIQNAIKSRTAWTIVVMFLISGVEGIREFVPAGWLPLVNGALSMLAIYFRIKPKQA